MERCGVCILGSTGSIGKHTLDVVKQHPNLFEVVALSAFQSIEILFEQCCYFKPRYVVVVNKDAAKVLKSNLQREGIPTTVLCGADNLCYISELPEVTKVVAAIVGAAGLMSTLSAARAGKQILLANKESLVMAGECLISSVQKSGATLLPVDSEHNALFQCMPNNYNTLTRPLGVQRLILTASGGPFLHTSVKELKTVTPEMACQHPVWKMGKKITVDSATLMNKGLEVIEACRLFQLTPHEVDVIIHPQSIIHSLVEYIDGSNLAQLGTPDMRIPIAYCLSWPERLSNHAKRLSLLEVKTLTFLPPDVEKFKCLSLAYSALALGKAAPAVLNASNEVVVDAFLSKRMRFSHIPIIIEEVLQKLFDLSASTIQDVLRADKLAREKTFKLIESFSQI